MDFNRIKEMGLEYAEKGKNAAMDLAERGKTQAKIVNEDGTEVEQGAVGSPAHSASWVRWCTVWPRATRRTSPLWISTSR